ncbi:MAG TPA: hypothetical protein VEI83_05775 [Acidimicrobiales bacterium]|nr:hypothetical protein [Acidimicrobiales bacterium]
MSRRVLVAGSYPPTPGASSAAALRAARQALAAGDRVVVVSPRPSAAEHTAPLQGWRGAWALARRGHAVQADVLVLSVEPGVPFGVGTDARRMRRQARLLALATAGFGRIEVLAPDGLGGALAPARPLWARAARVCVESEAARRDTLSLGLPAARVEVVAPAERRGEVFAGDPDAARAVTVPGPREWLPGEHAAHAAGVAERVVYRAEHALARLLRRLLGRHTAKVGRPVRAVVDPLRRRVIDRATRG